MDVLDLDLIADFFSPIFINPTFRFSAIVKYLDHKKSKIFKHPSFRFLPFVKYKNLGHEKSKIFEDCLSFQVLPDVKKENLDHKILGFSNIQVFDFHLQSNMKIWISKVRDFQRSSGTLSFSDIHLYK